MDKLTKAPWCVVALTVVCSFSAGECLGAETALAQEAVLEPGQAVGYAFQQIQANGDTFPALWLHARLDSPRLNGSTPALQIEVNGQPLGLEQAVNKTPDFVTLDGRVMNWFGSGGFRVIYSNDFTSAEPESGSANALTEPHPHLYVLNLSDLQRDGENELKLTHSQSRISNQLILADITVGTRQIAELPAEQAPGAGPPEGPLPVYEPKPVAPVDYRLQVADGGGIVLKIGKRRLVIETSVLTTGSPVEVLGEERPEGEPGLTVKPNAVTLSAEQYTFHRFIRPLDECIEVRDTLTSRNAAERLGVVVKHSVRLPGPPQQVHTNGIRRPLLKGRSAEAANPTTFVRLGPEGIGLLPIDDAFRLHAVNEVTDATASIEESGFIVQPSGKRTMSWAIFPLPKGDYWDFINAARRTLGTNFTLDGCFGFISNREPFTAYTEEERRDFVRKRSLKYLCSSIPKRPDGKYAHGSAFLFAPEERQALKEFLDLFRAANPGLRTLVYMHSYISTEDGAPEKYADERLMLADGSQAQYPYGYPLPLFVPTVGSAYAQQIEKYADLVLNEMGCDGIYWDEMAYSYRPYTFDGRWDGTSAQIDPQTGEIRRLWGHTSLLSQEFRYSLAERILQQGKTLIANGQPLTATMTELHFPRFVETASITNLTKAHLFSPIGLGDHTTETEEAHVGRQIRRHLDYGCLYYYYRAEIPATYLKLTSKMFPFTPIELHEGYIIGEERILTNRSGVFGWGDESEAEASLFAPDGRWAGGRLVSFPRGGRMLHEVRIAPGWVASLERVRPG